MPLGLDMGQYLTEYSQQLWEDVEQDLAGQLEEHISGCFEASIPDVGFTADHRTWAAAQSFGQALLDSGAADFDMSGAGVLS